MSERMQPKFLLPCWKRDVLELVATVKFRPIFLECHSQERLEFPYLRLEKLRIRKVHSIEILIYKQGVKKKRQDVKIYMDVYR